MVRASYVAPAFRSDEYSYRVPGEDAARTLTLTPRPDSPLLMPDVRLP